MAVARAGLIAWFLRYAQRLRFRTLFLLTSLLFVVNVIVPDMVPYVDEVLLGLGTVLLGSIRERKSAKNSAVPTDSGVGGPS